MPKVQPEHWTAARRARRDPTRGARAELALELLVAGDVPELDQVDSSRAELADVRLDLRGRAAATAPVGFTYRSTKWP